MTAFDYLLTLVDGGHLATLPAMELRVLLVFIRHANNEGEAWPGRDAIAAKLGINERNVRRAIAGLVRRGFMPGGIPGRGRGHVLKRAITIPENGAQSALFSDGENRAQCAPFCGEENGAQDGQKTGRRMVRKRGAVRPTKRKRSGYEAGRDARTGRKTAVGDHAALIDHFTRGWSDRYGVAYQFAGGKDGTAARNLLKLAGGLDEARRLVDAYLADADPYVAKQAHPLALLPSQVNRLRAAGAKSKNADPLACGGDDWEPVEPTPEILEMLHAPPGPGEAGYDPNRNGDSHE